MEGIACHRDGVEIMDRLLGQGESMRWAVELDPEPKRMLCSMIHNLAEKQAKTRFIVAQIKEDFGQDVPIEDVEALRDRFVSHYNITAKEKH